MLLWPINHHLYDDGRGLMVVYMHLSIVNRKWIFTSFEDVRKQFLGRIESFTSVLT